MAEQAVVDVPTIQVQTITVTIEGTSPLLTNNFSDAAKEQILKKQMKQPTGGKGAKDPQANYEASIYRTDDGRPGFPASGVKKACVNACRFIDDMKMTEARGAFYVMGDILPIDGEPQIHEAMVRLRGSTADIRYRAEYPDWRIDLPIKFNPRIITVEGIVNLLNTAGFHIGIGDWRPEKNGTHGMFHVSFAE